MLQIIILGVQIHNQQEGLDLLMSEDQIHKRQDEFPILTLEITIPKEGLHQIIILTGEPILNLLIDEVIALREIILLEVQAAQAAVALLQEIQAM